MKSPTMRPVRSVAASRAASHVHARAPLSSSRGASTTRPSASSADAGDAQLKRGIASFYDESSSLWESIWGEHMHHGYYDAGSAGSLTLEEHRSAQVRMIDEVLDWATAAEDAGPRAVSRVLDVGCGVGGSTRHIVRRFGSDLGCGITLSPYQAERATQITQEESELNPSGSEFRFQVADALDQPFDDASFDLIWSLESGEHMPDKAKFMSELYRVAKPGARIILVTWCHRILGEGETSLNAFERLLLAAINRAYFLPAWVSVGDYQSIAQDLGFADIRTGDWSENVAPFWTAVLRTAATPQGLAGLVRSGAKTARGAAVMPLMRLGFATGTIKFNLLTATKPF